jgi:chitinase
MKKNIILLLFIFPVMVSGQDIIAYYSGSAHQIRKYPVEKLTHIVFSFCHLDGNRFHVDTRLDSVTIHTLVRLKKRNPKLKILLSLGGWGGCKTCSAVFSTEAGRMEFARSVNVLARYFHTDGIDLDWEFPSLATYPDQVFRADDKMHFTQLVQTLKSQLDRGQEISVVCAGYAPYLRGSIDLPSVIPYIDRIHLMAYDLVGSHKHVTGHYSALYSTSWQEESADHALRYLDSLHIPHEKISIGVAFYGRQFRVLHNDAQGLRQPADYEKFVTMRRIRKQYTEGRGFKTYWDDEAKAAYKYNDKEKIFLTYDEERSVAAKAAYVKQKGLNGIFFWELRLDKSRAGLLDAIYRDLHP